MNMKEYMKTIQDKDDYAQIKREDHVSVFVFSAAWCPDCRFIEPFMPKLVEKYADYTFYYIDRDEWVSLAQEEMVMGIPSFIAYQGGSEVGRFVSKLRKSEAEIDAFLASLSE